MKNFLLFIGLSGTMYCSAQYVDIEGSKTVYTGNLEQLKTHEPPEWYSNQVTNKTVNK